jgi:hypothetical protein
MTPDQLAPFVNARTGAEIQADENDEDDLLVSVLFGYAKMAGIPSENILHDDRDLWLGPLSELTSSEGDGALREDARRRGRQVHRLPALSISNLFPPRAFLLSCTDGRRR